MITRLNRSTPLPRAKKLEYPQSDVAPARHERPVVIVHGTLVDKKSIEAYRDYALKTGHPVDWQDYQGITDGALLQDSARQVSHNVNQARQELARTHLADIQGRIAELQRMASELERVIADCAGGERGTCTILGALRRPGSAQVSCPEPGCRS